MGWGAERTVSHNGILFNGLVPFIQTTLIQNTDEGKPVKVSANKTVILCADGDAFHGFVRVIEDGGCSVQINRFVTVSYSGFDFTFGMLPILAAASGKVKWDGTAAQGTITQTVGLPTAEDTIVVGGQTYTFKALRAAVGQITIGASIDACVTNIAAAINLDSTVVTAVASTALDTVVLTAKVPGVAGNSIVFTEAATNIAVDGAGTLGTTVAGVDGTATKYLVTSVDATNKLVTFLLKQ
jgi:hypothetical protein